MSMKPKTERDGWWWGDEVEDRSGSRHKGKKQEAEDCIRDNINI